MYAGVNAPSVRLSNVRRGQRTKRPSFQCTPGSTHQASVCPMYAGVNAPSVRLSNVRRGQRTKRPSVQCTPGSTHQASVCPMYAGVNAPRNDSIHSHHRTAKRGPRFQALLYDILPSVPESDAGSVARTFTSQIPVRQDSASTRIKPRCASLLVHFAEPLDSSFKSAQAPICLIG